jgi:hypothetical protein
MRTEAETPLHGIRWGPTETFLSLWRKPPPPPTCWISHPSSVQIHSGAFASTLWRTWERGALLWTDIRNIRAGLGPTGNINFTEAHGTSLIITRPPSHIPARGGSELQRTLRFYWENFSPCGINSQRSTYWFPVPSCVAAEWEYSVLRWRDVPAEHCRITDKSASGLCWWCESSGRGHRYYKENTETLLLLVRRLVQK